VAESDWKMRFSKGDKIDDLKLHSTNGDVFNISDIIGKKH
jgi:hypothetical protein|tara:strand:- start:20 stop:139 length:120 start_codon:yes stop_codon:yes gene_type:complete